ncbi:hypothetical protein [Aurantibacillus circumpalustris]|uniref:hypothetical protein n=1 Tax=Aurantibacillus circumpalustris TaxID=3036359 RepID=UPI00295B3B88|nr:hypothetical protein [Aurantibacillus circumpalustris]
MNKANQSLYDELFVLATCLLQKGELSEDIHRALLQKSEDIVLVTVVIKEAKNHYYADLRKQGFRWILAGCIFGMTGMIVTLFNFASNRSIEMAMFGFTTVGIVVALWGVFKLIG